MKKLKPVSRWTIAISALLMITAYYVPLWQILMWAPQYPEGLEMKIWINTITGDVKIISALNHYIGMKHIEVAMFPEFKYMVYIVAFVILAGLLTTVINKRVLLWGYASLIVAAGVGALVDFYLWGYDYGHHLDPTAPIVVPGMSYQPPLIGTKQLLNFTAFSGPDIGGWVFLVAGILVIGTLVFELYATKKGSADWGLLKTAAKRLVTMKGTILIYLIAISLLSCHTNPEPLTMGKDACYTCKMTLVDNKFGAEIVTKKGKVYKFDDLNCMISFNNSGYEPQENIEHLLVVDFTQTDKLIDASKMFYCKSAKINSPMGSHVAAFEKKQELEKFNSEWQGSTLTWNELITQFK
jgi:copper chaperone NosL